MKYNISSDREAQAGDVLLCLVIYQVDARVVSLRAYNGYGGSVFDSGEEA